MASLLLLCCCSGTVSVASRAGEISVGDTVGGDVGDSGSMVTMPPDASSVAAALPDGQQPHSKRLSSDGRIRLLLASRGGFGRSCWLLLDDAAVLHAGGSAHAAVWAGAALPALTDGSALAEEDCAAGHVLGRVSGAHGFRDSRRKGCMTCTVIFCGA